MADYRGGVMRGEASGYRERGDGNDDGPSDAGLVAMTIRHGADYAKRHLDGQHRTELHRDQEDEA
jgi:hypothetical protein